MKKILLILLLVPSFVFGQTYYRIYADTTIFGSIGSGKNEVVIKNRTKDSTGGFLSNKGNGVLEFKKLRNKKINDSTYVIVSGTTVLGDTLKIKGSGVSGGGVSQSALNDSIATVRNIRNVDTIYKVTDSIVYSINGVRYSVIDNSGGGGSDSLIYNRTYLDLVNNVNGSELIKGAKYKITDRGDRGLFFTALSDNQLDNYGHRLMLCPAVYGIGNYLGHDWVGVWHSSKTANVDDLTVWGGLVWKNLTGNIGTATDDFTLDATNWVLVPKTSFTNEYTELEFEVAYDFNADWITKQYDKYDNIVGYPTDGILGYQPCDVTDWNSTTSFLAGTGGVAVYANHKAVLGIFNNTQQTSDGYIISGNSCSKISGNNCGSINGNTTATISNNNNTGTISFNTSTAITGLTNTVGDVVSNNTSADAIDGTVAPFDTWTGDIQNLSFKTNTATDNSVTKIVGVNANGETKMVDKSSIGGGETIVELGTIDYNDINSAGAVANFSYVLDNAGLANKYVTGFLIKIDTAFVTPSAPEVITIKTFSTNAQLTTVETIYLSLSDISEATAVLLGISLSDMVIYNVPSSQTSTTPIEPYFGALFYNTSTPSTNTADYTAGSVTIYAITKPFPF